MEKHFEFVPGDEKVLAPGRTVKRIRALLAIDMLGVSPGDVGGYVEKSENLSGNAWVSGDAWVYGDAWVFGDARVYGGAQVFGNARVSGGAQVFGNAQVYGNARVFGDARVYGGAQVFGDARVSGGARIYGNAQVSGNAWVFGDARVYGGAQVFGDAQVSGGARIYGNAQVSGNAWVSGNAVMSKLTDHLQVGPAKSSGRFTTAHVDSNIGVRVNCGCFSGTVFEFSKAIEETHQNNKEHLEQYRLFCQLIAFNFGVEA